MVSLVPYQHCSERVPNSHMGWIADVTESSTVMRILVDHADSWNLIAWVCMLVHVFSWLYICREWKDHKHVCYLAMPPGTLVSSNCCLRVVHIVYIVGPLVDTGKAVNLSGIWFFHCVNWMSPLIGVLYHCMFCVYSVFVSRSLILYWSNSWGQSCLAVTIISSFVL